MATKKSTDFPSASQTPGDLSALAARLRAQADSIRNPAAKAAMGADMTAAAQVIEDLVKLYEDVHSGDNANVLRAVLRLFPVEEG